MALLQKYKYLLLLAILLSTLIKVAKADDSYKCYSSIPSSYGSGSTFTYQSSGHCQQQCSSYSYYALYDGNTCMCSNDAPDSDDETDSSNCNVGCSGYGQQSCGGKDAYQVYTQSFAASGSSTTAASSSTDSSSSSSSSGTSATSSSATKTTDSTSESTYVHLITQVATQSGGGTHIVTVTASKTSVKTSVVSGTSDNSNSNSKTKLIGPIVGGVIGGLAALSILALVIFFIRRQRQKDRDLLDADANVIATMKRNENPSHTRQLSNPFADDFVDPRHAEYYGDTGFGQESTNNNHMNLGDDGTDYYEPKADTGRPKLAVVNPDKD